MQFVFLRIKERVEIDSNLGIDLDFFQLKPIGLEIRLVRLVIPDKLVTVLFDFDCPEKIAERLRINFLENPPLYCKRAKIAIDLSDVDDNSHSLFYLNRRLDELFL